MNDESKNSGVVYDAIRIMEMIPHRFPFLMIDRVTDIVSDISAVRI